MENDTTILNNEISSSISPTPAVSLKEFRYNNLHKPPVKREDMVVDGHDKVLTRLLRTVEDLQNEVNRLKIGKIKEITNLPEETLKKVGIELPNAADTLRKHHSKYPILETEIKEAMERFPTWVQMAEHLGVTREKLIRYAKKYDIYVKGFFKGKGGYRRYNPNIGRFPLNKLIAGEFPEYPLGQYLKRLINTGLKKRACEKCGFSEKRVTDNKFPLVCIIDDNNEKNRSLNNIKIYCYNCAYLYYGDHYKIQRKKRHKQYYRETGLVQGNE